MFSLSFSCARSRSPELRGFCVCEDGNLHIAFFLCVAPQIFSHFDVISKSTIKTKNKRIAERRSGAELLLRAKGNGHKTAHRWRRTRKNTMVRKNFKYGTYTIERCNETFHFHVKCSECSPENVCVLDGAEQERVLRVNLVTFLHFEAEFTCYPTDA